MFNKHVLIHGYVLGKYGIDIDKKYNLLLKNLTLNILAFKINNLETT